MLGNYHAIIMPLARRIFALLEELDELRGHHSTIVTLLLCEGPGAVEHLRSAFGTTPDSSHAALMNAFEQTVRAARIPTLADRAEILGPIVRSLKAKGARARAG